MDNFIKFELNDTKANLHYKISDSEKQKVLSIIDKYQLSKIYDADKEIIVSCYNILEQGSDILSSHSFWKPSQIPQILTPSNLPRIETTIYSDLRLFNFGLSFIDKLNPGMGSFWGFSGYYLSTIIDLEKSILLDARGVETT